MRHIIFLQKLFMLALLLSYPVYGQDDSDPQQHLEIQSIARMHGIHSNKLKGHMQRMIGVLMKEPSDKSDAAEMEKYLARLVKSSANIAAASASLHKYVPEGELNENEKETFKKLAEQLHSEALIAENHAREGNITGLKLSMTRFNQTCVECHRLFREK